MQQSKEDTMEQTPLTPAPTSAPAKPNNVPIIIAVIAAALLSLCCCGTSLPVFMGAGTYDVTGITGTESGGIPPLYGLVCVGAGIIPWFIPLIVFLMQKSKK
jgi:hypothetical protein